MTIFKGSRLRKLRTGQVLDTDKNVHTVFAMDITTLEPPASSKEYTVKAGETFETIAAREYGDANKWNVLAKVNSHIFFALDLVAGDVIVIPTQAFVELQ